MIRNYTSERLPFNFIALGFLLLGLGIWRMIVMDWMGILFTLISLLLLFTKSGVIIDSGNKRIKKYTGFLMIRKGEWEDIRSFSGLQIIETTETQTMSVLSITRTGTEVIYKLILNLPDRDIELSSGKKKKIARQATKIARELQTTVSDENQKTEN